MSTRKQLLDALVSGYMSQEFDVRSTDIHYPNALNGIIVNFAAANMFLSFDLVHDIHGDCIQDNIEGTLISTSPSKDAQNFNICSSYTFTEGKIHSFGVKCSKRESWASEFVGITSDIKEFIREYYSCVMQLNANIYYYYGNGGIIEGFETKNRTGETQDAPRWNVGDIITVQVDCIDWKFTIYHNDQKVGHSFAIVPNQQYHAFITVKSNNSEFQLMA